MSDIRYRWLRIDKGAEAFVGYAKSYVRKLLAASPDVTAYTRSHRVGDVSISVRTVDTGYDMIMAYVSLVKGATTAVLRPISRYIFAQLDGSVKGDPVYVSGFYGSDSIAVASFAIDDSLANVTAVADTAVIKGCKIKVGTFSNLVAEDVAYPQKLVEWLMDNGYADLAMHAFKTSWQTVLNGVDLLTPAAAQTEVNKCIPAVLVPRYIFRDADGEISVLHSISSNFTAFDFDRNRFFATSGNFEDHDPQSMLRTKFFVTKFDLSKHIGVSYGNGSGSFTCTSSDCTYRFTNVDKFVIPLDKLAVAGAQFLSSGANTAPYPPEEVLDPESIVESGQNAKIKYEISLIGNFTRSGAAWTFTGTMYSSIFFADTFWEPEASPAVVLQDYTLYGSRISGGYWIDLITLAGLPTYAWKDVSSFDPMVLQHVLEVSGIGVEGAIDGSLAKIPAFLQFDPSVGIQGAYGEFVLAGLGGYYEPYTRTDVFRITFNGTSWVSQPLTKDEVGKTGYLYGSTASMRHYSQVRGQRIEMGVTTYTISTAVYSGDSRSTHAWSSVFSPLLPAIPDLVEGVQTSLPGFSGNYHPDTGLLIWGDSGGPSLGSGVSFANLGITYKGTKLLNPTYGMYQPNPSFSEMKGATPGASSSQYTTTGIGLPNRFNRLSPTDSFGVVRPLAYPGLTLVYAVNSAYAGLGTFTRRNQGGLGTIFYYNLKDGKHGLCVVDSWLYRPLAAARRISANYATVQTAATAARALITANAAGIPYDPIYVKAVDDLRALPPTTNQATLMAALTAVCRAGYKVYINNFACEDLIEMAGSGSCLMIFPPELFRN